MRTAPCTHCARWLSLAAGPGSLVRMATLLEREVPEAELKAAAAVEAGEAREGESIGETEDADAEAERPVETAGDPPAGDGNKETKDDDVDWGQGWQPVQAHG